MFFSQFLLIVVMLLITPSQALFFHYSRNALMNFFSSLREKKEMKRPPDIHHYHLHYYPMLIHSHIKTIKAPDKQELENLHTNKLESYGWGNQEFKHIPEPSIHYNSGSENWSNSISYSPASTWDESIGTLERREESKSNGIFVQVPLSQQIILQQPEKEKPEKETNPLFSFFQKLHRIKNSIFDTSRSKADDDGNDVDTSNKNNKLNGIVVYTHPNAITSYFKKL